jgi:hypothetical protein
MPEGYAAYLLDRDVDALRSVYAECGVTALLDDATTIINAAPLAFSWRPSRAQGRRQRR